MTYSAFVKWLAPAAVVLVAWALARGADRPAATDGDALYDRYCLACHGAAGDGKGPAAPWLWPKPRDLTTGKMKWRTTPSGKPPTDDDLRRVIREGAPGTSMPAFALSDAQVDALVAKVKSFAPKRYARIPTAITIPAAPADLASRAERGRELWSSMGCAECHGAGGKGDGKADAKPYDLTASPLRRKDVYATLVTGIDGTGMGAFESAAPDDLWALVAHVEQIRYKGRAVTDTTVHAANAKESSPLGFTIDPQGTPPDTLPPAAASLSAKQCARCHAKQHREWSGSIHAAAASPGTLGQFKDHATAKSCQKCHAPLAEQMPGSSIYDEDLRAEGITCAACHLRGWTRHGPPRRVDSALLALPSYPLVEELAYERADFCLPCHQLEPDDAVNGRPLLNTYREWLEGPYMRRGVQCQHCHMPDREHTWKGVHDRATVAQALDVEIDGAKVTLRNVGAGHNFPTTPTPAAFLRIEMLDAKDKVLATWEKRIGRHIQYDKGWKELEDTRIPPGETLTFFPPKSTKNNGARRVRVTLTMAPDDYYEGFYRRLLENKKLPADRRALLEEALARAQKSKFRFYEKTVDLQ